MITQQLHYRTVLAGAAPERFLAFEHSTVDGIAAAQVTAANLCHGSDVSSVTAETFGEKLKKAIELKSRHLKTQKQHEELAEKERERYQQPATTQAH
jgi:hypothetical protein